MPEGDTVWRTARRLDRGLTASVLRRTDFRVPQLATTDLTGATVLGTVSRGKHLLTRVRAADGGTWSLHTHLRMEGAWRVLRADQRWPRPAHQARVVLTTDEVVAVGFSLGVVEVLATDDEADAVGHLGPDLLGPDWDEDEAVRRLLDRPDRAVRDALLDQRCLAGVGNMYAAELCFVSGVHPTSPVGQVPDLRRLVRRAKQMLELNKQRPTQATTGDLREPLWVYARDGRPCRRCRTRVEMAKEVLDPGSTDARPDPARAAYWCPRCQPRP